MKRETLYVLCLILAVCLVENSTACKKILNYVSSSDDQQGHNVEDRQDQSTVSGCDMSALPVDITIVVRNKFQEPFFEHKVMVEDTSGMTLIQYLQKAADVDPHFKFSADYYGSLGFMITRINGLSGSMDDKTYWNMLEAQNYKSLKTGVSGYVPVGDEQIMFNFTTWATGDDH